MDGKIFLLEVVPMHMAIPIGNGISNFAMYAGFSLLLNSDKAKNIAWGDLSAPLSLTRLGGFSAGKGKSLKVQF